MLAQEAVARIVGVTASQVSKWEHARGPVPQPRNLRSVGTPVWRRAGGATQAEL